jgi:hypothetical protein
MKALRVLVTVVIAGGLAYLLFRGMHCAPPPTAPTPAVPTPAPDDGASPTPFSPFGDPPNAKETAAPAAAPPTAPDVDGTLGGTPTTSTSDVSLVIPYKTGTKCRYRVNDAELMKDRATNEVWWGRRIWTVSTEVMQGDGSGAARIRFQIDSFRYQTDAPGRRIDIDSENPDRRLLDDPKFDLARGIKPWLAVRGVPVEFVIDEHGVIRAVEGVKAMNRKFLDVVSTFGSQQEQDADDAPTAENMIEKWGERLFPTFGGGKLRGDATREASFDTTYVDRWRSVASGKLRATNDDPDAFRVEFKGAPTIQELNRPAVHPKFVSVEKAKVQSSADAYVLAWRIDRAKGRLLASRKRANYTLVVGYRSEVVNGEQQYVHPWLDLELWSDVELIEP